MRPFIEFVQHDALAWEEGFLPATTRRVLSTDPDSGALSEITSYPPGWTQPAGRALGAAEEIFVLAGSLTVAGERLGRFGYARFPAGYSVETAHSDTGAVVATFYSRDPGTRPEPGWDPRTFVAAVDCLRCPASPLRTPGFTSAAKRIDLFDDPDTGDSTWLMASPSLRCDELRPEKHPVAEEMLLVGGEMHSPYGVMRPGAYFWRPAQEWHGPFGSVSGAISLFRTHGGPLSTVYAEHEAHFDWDAEYDPVLPAQLRPAAAAAHDRHDDLSAWGAPRGLVGAQR
jgi:hypothetical protein